MNIQTLQLALNELSQTKSVFCAEADFQFAFAWELQKLLPQAKISLEYPVRISSRDYHVDIWIEDNGRIYPIELKYKTKGGVMDGMKLKNHAAVDFGCYDYLYDIYRIERLKMSVLNFHKGWAVMLTNEPLYYNNANRPSAYNNFKIFQGAVKCGPLNWELTNKGKIFNCGKRIGFSLTGSYKMNWKNYNSNFRYLINEI